MLLENFQEKKPSFQYESFTYRSFHVLVDLQENECWKREKNQDYKKRLKDSCPRVSTDVMQIVVSGLSKVRRNPVVIVKLSRMRLRSVICAILISSEDLCFKEKKTYVY